MAQFHLIKKHAILWAFHWGQVSYNIQRLTWISPGKYQTARCLDVSTLVLVKIKPPQSTKPGKYLAHSLRYNSDTLAKYLGSGPRNLSCASITISWTPECATTSCGSTAHNGENKHANLVIKLYVKIKDVATVSDKGCEVSSLRSKT